MKYDSQKINLIYEHFENGAPAPDGVDLKLSFTKTIGRALKSNSEGHKIVRV